ncbi:MAG: radical SAM protein [Candidatus Thermoplasmatota archaeon]
MRVIAEYGRDDLAKVYVASIREHAEMTKGHKSYIEFVESIQPPRGRDEKWVLIISSMIGCPVNCLMCDAGGYFKDLLTAEEILTQIKYMVNRRYPDGRPLTKKLKIQFARMGEPSFNMAVLEVLESLPSMYDQSILYPSLSTVAPLNKTSELFFDKLIDIKDKFYTQSHFQLQFSIHTTDEEKRDILIPIKKWSFKEIASYGERFTKTWDGDLKVTLNFASVRDYPIDVKYLRDYFNPDCFLIKLTPVNPTIKAHKNCLSSYINPYNPHVSNDLTKEFKKYGYEVIISIGELEENQIGSNCGQFIQQALNTHKHGDIPDNSYNLDHYLKNKSE